MKKNIIVSLFNAKKGSFLDKSCLFCNTDPETAIRNFIQQILKNDYSTWTYPETLPGKVYRSKILNNRFLYDYSEDIIIYADINN